MAFAFEKLFGIDINTEEGRQKFRKELQYSHDHPEESMTKIVSLTPEEEWELIKDCHNIEDVEGYKQLKAYIEGKKEE